MSRIYYFCPDFSEQSAGTMRLYRHVVHLNRLGREAYIIHEKKDFKLIWHEYSAPLKFLENEPEFDIDDILVFPEAMATLMKHTKDFTCTRVAIILNWAYAYMHLPRGENWKDYGIKNALTPSPYIKDFIEWSMGLNVTLIDSFIDTKKFYNQPDIKQNKIAYMSRKDESGEILRQIFEKKYGNNSKFKWVHLHNLSHDEYAKQLRESRIFIATSCQEGMPTSILESMSSGCLVIGFTGVGGNDYMIGSGDRQNCWLVENGNYPELGKLLEQIILQYDNNRSIHNKIIMNASKTAMRFDNFEKEGLSLLKFFQNLNCKTQSA